MTRLSCKPKSRYKPSGILLVAAVTLRNAALFLLDENAGAANKPTSPTETRIIWLVFDLMQLPS